ncbi:DEAD/DEAH box helicase family protein [Bacillus safensis]|uniref:DEAD/DEAH box helicase n=1 Tax=Bacillus TaxID=1386 RepID=UPI000A67FF97|nr:MULTISPECIES: DEAD/DEAH box helicase family protein [Bacillus]MCY7585111.1 DEAD/DEAH box helicase family protein [Bacillus safensis]MCY7589260.1 DEAD/DEAH box helicase family protein [Bacillus safensis]MCY7610899.1 DEAD/DEAH box helicase family protein [Bacillus safensis]
MIKLFPFQEQAIQTLQDIFFFSDKQTTVFYSPTGSGKTVMLINLMDRILEFNPNSYDYAFIWLTPGNGELEEQSWSKAKNFSKQIIPINLDEALTNGFQAGTATFLNWERVKNDKAIAIREGETKNLDDIINEAKSKSIHFVLIIDEEHRDQTEKAQNIINKFNADKIIRASATPKSSSPDYDNVQVNDEDVISQGLIVRNVELNPDGVDGDVVDNMVQYFLDFADDKRRKIKAEYTKLGLDINPLVLIQFPDEKTVNKQERKKLIKQVKAYLSDIGQGDGEVATWLANEKMHIEEIEKQNSPINYLLMKQAVATGWDAPRAKVLVKLRLNTDPSFTLQTIGRIRRMPQQKHYNNELLDNAFIYSNDQEYISDVLQKGEGVFIATYELNSKAPDFNLLSVKPNVRTGLTNNEVLQALRKQFKEDYGLIEQNGKQNREKLENYGYRFGTMIYQRLTRSDKIERDILSGDFLTYEVEMPVSARDNRLDLLNAEQMIQKYLYRDSPKDVNHILLELFSNRSEDITKRFLSLKPSEFMAFVINNYKLIRETAKNADTSGSFDKQLSLEYGISHDELDLVKFIPPKVEMYQVNKNGKGKIFNKNIYNGYGENNWVKTKKPEIAFETWLDNSEQVSWWYRNKDRGEQYFSIAYGQKKEGFFPDYIFVGTNGITYIVETKGGNGQNIDHYSEAKFKAIRAWSENLTTNPYGAKFAFVRPIKNDSGEVSGLLYNDSVWNEDMNDITQWKSISDFWGNNLF